MEFEFYYLPADSSSPARTEPDEPADTAPSPSDGGDPRPEEMPSAPAGNETGGGSSTDQSETDRLVKGQRPVQSGQTEGSHQNPPAEGTQEIPSAINPAENGSAEEDVFDQTQTINSSAMTIAPSQEAQPNNFVLPFFGGVFAALLLGAVGIALYRRKRRPAPSFGKNVGSGNVAVASIHELGAREDQQDAYGIIGASTPEQGVLAAVADGMGGLVNSGQVSSALVEGMMEAYAPDEETGPARQLQILFVQALSRVEQLMKDSTAQSGSTLVACLIKGSQLSWLSVGDSRIYLWRNGGLVQLNRDHDFYHDLVSLAMQGDMALSEADSDPRRENLTSYIGRGFPRKVEWNPEPVQLVAGDKVLLVSDGVYRALSQNEMADCLRGSPQEAAEALRATVEQKRYPQQDNYTAVMLSQG